MIKKRIQTLYYYVYINSLRTLLNGETLMKLQAFNTCASSQENLNEQEIVQNPGNSSIQTSAMQKGLESLDNPVLRGSFNLILNEEKLNSLDEIAKKAFIEVMSKEWTTVTPSNSVLRTVHLETDPGKIQNKRTGVYIIQNIETGGCIVGQTTDLKKRFNQYTSRSQALSLEANKINKNFSIAVQEALKNGLDYNQIFQRFVVYTWVDQDKKALDIQNSLPLKNEMNYLEHRLLLAFFECGLAYNIEDVAPQLTEKVILPPTTNFSSQTKRIPFPIGNLPKPFKFGNNYFSSSAEYEKFRKSLDAKNRRDFLSMPYVRKKLKENANNSTASIRYLTKQEIEKVSKAGLFYKPN